MPKPLKSQWQFGELFPSEPARRVFSVSEITGTIRKLVEGQVGSVWVAGEITNFRLQSSGHAYFGLKDAGAQLSCVLFRDEARAVHRAALRDGQQVVLHGAMTVYEARGQYQLRVTKVEWQGVGALQAAFERLKEKLNAEGLFDAARKRPLPRFPQRIGLVTSPTGAALRDVLHVIARRHPALEIVLAPCRVQGQGAAEEIARAIRWLNEFNRASSLDLILLTRGGGSLEDLWAFNEEAVARALFDSELPVVSAIGHEIDFTIADFVADVRAATPSVAAEIITQEFVASREFVAAARDRLGLLVRRSVASARATLERSGAQLRRLHPRRRLQDAALRLDDACGGLWRAFRRASRDKMQAASVAVDRFSRIRPLRRLANYRETLVRLATALRDQSRRQWAQRESRLAVAANRLRLLSPRSVLDRGYSITTDAASGTILRDATLIPAGTRLQTLLKNGRVISVAESSRE